MEQIKTNNELEKIVLERIKNLNYREVAENIKRMWLLPREKRNSIIQRVNLCLSRKTIEEIGKEITYMNYEKEIYDLVGIKYSNGPPKGENFFISGFIDYLTKN